MTYSNKHRLLLTAALASLFSAAPAYAQQTAAQQQDKAEAESTPGVIRLSTGINYSSGDYGDLQNTKVWSAPVALKYSKDNFSIRVSVPYVHISGPGSLLQTPEGRDSGGGGRSDNSGPGSSNSGSGSSGSGSGGSGSSGSGSSGSGEVEVDPTAPLASKRSGIGDTVVTATYSFDLGGGFWLDASGKVKLPTASKAKRLGTGKADFTGAFDLGKDVGPASFYIHGRRKFAGNSAATPIRDTWGAGGGASIKAGEGVTVGADYDWQQSAFAGRKASSEITGWTNFRLAQGFNLSLFASTGFNSNSADFAGGMTLSIRLN